MFFLNALLATAVVALPALAGWTTCCATAEAARAADTDTSTDIQKTLIWVSWVLWIAAIFCHAMAWHIVAPRSREDSLSLPAALIFVELCTAGLTILGAAFVDAEVRAEKRRLEQLNRDKDADAS